MLAHFCKCGMCPADLHKKLGVHALHRYCKTAARTLLQQSMALTVCTSKGHINAVCDRHFAFLVFTVKKSGLLFKIHSVCILLFSILITFLIYGKMYYSNVRQQDDA